jgi:hypothetical protein
MPYPQAALRAACLVLALLAGLARASPAAAYGCPERPSCSGCGCRGGTGYRAPDGHCVGFRELARVCGPNPARVCSFENRPNTGLNHDCALRRAPKRDPGPTHPSS